MKYKYLLLSFIVINIFSCNAPKNNTQNNKKKPNFVLHHSIELPISDNRELLKPYTCDYKVIDGIETFIIARKDIKKIIFYDLKKQKVYNEFNLSYSELYHFKYINKDSIYLFYVNQLDPNNYVDSTQLVRVNFQGKILEYFPYNNNLIWNKTNQPISKEIGVYPSLLGNKLYITDNQALLLLDKEKPYNIGSKDFFINKSPIISRYDLKKKKLYTSNNLWYPFIKEGDFYPSDFAELNLCIAEDNFPLIRFFYSSKLFKWNYKTNNIHQYTLKSLLIDTIKPLDYETRSSTNNIPAMYLNISYDKYNELYYSVLFFSEEIYGGRIWSLIIADKDFNYIGETINPKMGHFSPLFTKDYIISTSIGRKGYFNVDFYKLEFENTNYSDYLSSMKGKLKHKRDSINKLICKITGSNNNLNTKKAPIIKYFNDYIKVDTNNYAVISIYEKQGCPSCKDKVLQFISNNATILNTMPLYLNISSSNYQSGSNYIKTKSIYKFNNIYIDTNKTYMLFDKFSNKNPRLTLINNNIVFSDTIYNPNDIDKLLIPKLLNFLKLE